MNSGLAAPRRLFVAALVIVTSVSLAAPAASADEERVYLDVNQPRYADVNELAGDADLIVLGTVAATVSQTAGPMLQEVHEFDVAHTVQGQPHRVVRVVQDVGSAAGAVHVEGQRLLDEGSSYVLYLAAEGQLFRTVGGAQGVFVLSSSGWVSAAPSREDLVLGPLVEMEATSQAGPTAPPVVTVSSAPSVTDGPSTTPLAPGESDARDPSAKQTGPRAWLLAVAFLAGLALGAAAMAVAFARRRVSASSGPRSGARKAPGAGEASVQPPAVPVAESRTPPEWAAAVMGLIAVADLTDSPVLLAQVERSLRQAGVEIVTATDGQPFDTEWHHGVGVVPAPTPDLDLSVARVVRPGWRTADGLLRPVEVEVYRSDIS